MASSEFRAPDFLSSRRFVPGLEPQAKTGNIYVAPQRQQIAADAGDSEAEQLAKSLARNEPKLQVWLKQRYDNKNDAAYREGIRLAVEQNITSWADWVKKNPKYEKVNPYLQLGVEDQLVFRRSSEASLEIAKRAQEETAGLTNADEIQAKSNQITQEVLQKYGTDLSDISASKLIDLVNNTNKTIYSQIGENKLKQSVEQKYDDMSSGNMGILSVGLTTKQSASQIADIINANAQSALKWGADPKRVNDLAISSITASIANMSNQDDIDKSLQVMTLLTGKDGKPLIAIPEYAIKLKQAKDLALLNAEKVEQQVEIEKKQQKDNILSQALPALLTQPFSNWAPKLMQLATINGKVDNGLFEDLMKSSNQIFSYYSSRLNFQQAQQSKAEAAAKRAAGGSGRSSGGSGSNESAVTGIYSLTDNSNRGIKTLTDLNDVARGQRNGNAIIALARYGLQHNLFGDSATKTGKINKTAMNKATTWANDWLSGKRDAVEVRYNTVANNTDVINAILSATGESTDTLTISQLNTRNNLVKKCRLDLAKIDEAFVGTNGRHMTQDELNDVFIGKIAQNIIDKKSPKAKPKEQKQPLGQSVATQNYLKVTTSYEASNNSQKSKKPNNRH